MGPDFVRLANEALYLSLLLSLPVLAVSLAVGLSVSVLQAVTQVQEQTLSFVPKLVAVGLALALFGGFMGRELVRFTAGLWNSIPLWIP
ncbi:MAG: flagellar biosynthesis protein FliQ [Myxococcales bacterium]|nr:flagellar biosynthesis protein FliQ [Myxococcales bacterium]